MATTSPVFILVALYTVPKAPSPKVLIVLYFYIPLLIINKIYSSKTIHHHNLQTPTPLQLHLSSKFLPSLLLHTPSISIKTSS